MYTIGAAGEHLFSSFLRAGSRPFTGSARCLRDTSPGFWLPSIPRSLWGIATIMKGVVGTPEHKVWQPSDDW